MNEMRRLMEAVEPLFTDFDLSPDSFTVNVTDEQVVDPGSEEDYIPEVSEVTAEILQNGQVVGTMRRDDYMGSIRGILFNKDLPDLDNYKRDAYDGLGDIDEDSKEMSVFLTRVLQNFLSTKTGQRWAANIHKYANAAHTNDYRLR